MLRGGATIGEDLFVAHLAPDGRLLYATYLGGSCDDSPTGIALDAEGSAYLVGDTYSTDLPVGSGTSVRPPGISAAFVTKLDAAGRLLYTSYLNNSPGAIAVVGDTVYLVGASESDLPGAGTEPPSYDASLALLDTATGALRSTHSLGGSRSEFGSALAIDAEGNAYIGGTTASIDFPVSPGALEPVFRSSD